MQLFKDARYFQILFQCSFLGYGIFYLDWKAGWGIYATYLAVSLTTQIMAEIIVSKIKYHKRPSIQRIKGGLPSAIISSLGLCLLLKTNSFTIAALAAFASIASKYLIRIRGKHIFNPSALGIVVAVWFTREAWISPGQWGSNTVILFGVICLGVIVVTKVQKLDISLAFLGTFAGLLFLRQVVYLGWPPDYFLQSLSTGSLLIFSFFMITDPKTTPDHPLARILWGMAVAGIAFYLTAFRFVNGAPIWVLIGMQTMVPLLDLLFKSNRFAWKHSTLVDGNESHLLNAVYNHSIM